MDVFTQVLRNAQHKGLVRRRSWHILVGGAGGVTETERVKDRARGQGGEIPAKCCVLCFQTLSAFLEGGGATCR